MRATYWLALRGLIGGTVAGIVVVLGLMWTAGDLLQWESKQVSIAVTILLFAFSGAIGGAFMGKQSNRGTTT
jgi:hypothetical protein